MFYNRLRWKIHDLEDEVSNLIDRNDTLTMRCKISDEEIKVLRNKIKVLQEDLEVAKFDLEMEEKQHASAEKEVERLHGENNRLKYDLNMMQGWRSDTIELKDQIAALKKENKELRNKCGCPCKNRT